MVAETLERFGRIDILVNAVGGGAGKALHPAEAYPRSDWDWIMELNLRSTIVPTQAVAQAMIAAGPGRADPEHLVGSGEPRDQRRLLGLCRGEGRDQLADPAVGDRMGEVRHPCRTRSCRPSWTRPRSRRCSRTRPFKAGIVSRIPLGRVGETRDLVGPAIFLCSDAASFVTGQVLGIDGGLTATQ